jgi:outer membrane protein assembly factor BamB
MQQFVTRQRRLSLSFLPVACMLIAVTFALPACTSSIRGCGVIIPPDVSVQVDNGITYIAGLNSVRAVRTTNGSQLWQTMVGEYASALILDNGVLYVVSSEILTAIRASDGKHLWQFLGPRAV